MVLGEVFEEEAEFAKGFDGDEVGVVDDGNDDFSPGVEVPGFGDQTSFAFVISAIAIEIEGLAEQAQDVSPGVEGTIDDGGDPCFCVMVQEVVFEDGFAGSGFADDQAEATLLGVDFEDVKVTLLVGQQTGGVVDDEGVFGETEVLSNHDMCWRLGLEVVGTEVGFAVVMDGVQEDGGAEALVVEVDDGRIPGTAGGEAAEAQGDGFPAKIAGGFVADFLELEGVVGAHFSGLFEVEKLLVELALVEVTDAAQVEAEAVEWAHAEGAVISEVVGVFDPVGEVFVEFLQTGNVIKVLDEVLVADGAEEAFDLAFGSSVADGGVDEDGAEAGADLAELFGGVICPVVSVDRLWDPALIKGTLEAIDEVLGVIGIEELPVGDDAGGVIDEGDEEDLNGSVVAWEAEVGSVKGVALPEVVGVGLGEGEPPFGQVGRVGLEQVVFVDGASKGIDRDLVTPEVALLDAGAVEGLDVEGTFGVFTGTSGPE